MTRSEGRRYAAGCSTAAVTRTLFLTVTLPVAVAPRPTLLLLLAALALMLALVAGRPQDASTNNIVPEALGEEDGESLVASLILAVARDWDLGMEDATEFVRAVPAATVSAATAMRPDTQ